tara:strand:- start:2356 stop:2517 length:162 start_codon:yes stop_codon:yes gene_type:complete
MLKKITTLATGILGVIGLTAIVLFVLHKMGVEQVESGVENTLIIIDKILGIRV